MPELLIPQNTKDLYDMMCNTPQLCGKFELIGKTIFWNLFKDIEIEISIEPPSTYFGINKKLFHKISASITHWHPTCEDVYNDVLNIGSEGNVLVIRKNLLFDGVIYAGKKADCPYSPKTKWRFGRIFFLAAKMT